MLLTWFSTYLNYRIRCLTCLKSLYDEDEEEDEVEEATLFTPLDIVYFVLSNLI